jgi:UPF0755 protein
MGKKFFLFFVLAPLVALSLAGVKVYYDLSIWTYKGPEVVFTIKPGENFSKINGRLNNNNLISNPKVFHRYCQFKGYLTSFRTGSFKIPTGVNMLEIINILLNDPGITVSITIPEGKNIFEIGKLLDAGNVTPYNEFIKWAKNPQFMKELNIPADRVEGYLYPNTYKFSPKSSAKHVIRAMVKEFRKVYRDLAKFPTSLSEFEVVTLASIVEKETGAAHERPAIAGVFHNRLKKRMRLQSDPTTIYGIYETYKGNLKKRHLREKTPYNTYRVNGLPKGPISNPGKESLKAVLKPSSHNNLYFVSKNDGTHIFSKTYRDHRNAVKKWQQTRANRRGRSWRDLNKKTQ